MLRPAQCRSDAAVQEVQSAPSAQCRRRCPAPARRCRAPLDVRFVSIVSRLGLDTLYLIVSTGAHLYLESTTYHHYFYTTRGAAAGAPIGISGSGTTSLLPPSERVAMFAPRRARSGLGFATGGIAADCRPCRVQVRYFIPQYTLYLCICHCICIVSRLGLDTLYHSVSTDTLHCI